MNAHGHQTSHEHHSRHTTIDSGYRLIVRTILWIIAGLVFLAFGCWWVLT